MKIDVSLEEELFDCPELPEGINPYHISLWVDGKYSPTVFAVDTEKGIVNLYRMNRGGPEGIEIVDGHPVVEEIKYKTLHVMWNNKAGISGEETYFVEGA